MKIKKYVMRLVMLLVMQNVCAMDIAQSNETKKFSDASYEDVARYLLKHPKEQEKVRTSYLEVVKDNNGEIIKDENGYERYLAVTTEFVKSEHIKAVEAKMYFLGRQQEIKQQTEKKVATWQDAEKT